MWSIPATSSTSSILLLAVARPGPPHFTATRRITSPQFLKGPKSIISPPSSSPFRHSPDAAGARLLPACGGGAVATEALLQDAGATALVMAGAYSLVLAFDALTKSNLIEQSLSRKVVHVLSGLLFMFSWPIFSLSSEARYFAAFVPLVNCIRLISYGLCLVTDEGLVKSVTREGRPEELLRGPLYFVMVLMFCTVIFWRESPIGLVSLAMMSGGDGFADIVGRRYGAVKLPYNRHKSWIGSMSMFIFGFIFSAAVLYYYTALGFIHLNWSQAAGKLAVVSLVATVVESFSTGDIVDDNISVPLSSMVTALLLFG